MRKSIFASLLMVLCPILVAQQTLNDDAIIKMTKAGLSDDIIITSINSQPGTFDISPDALVTLKTGGVSDKVISAIVSRHNAPTTPAAPVATPTSGSADPSRPADSSTAIQPTDAVVISGRNVPAGAKLYIAPMQGNLDSFLAAEILKQKVPLTVVAADSQADLIMTGLNVKEDDHWYNAVWGGKDKNEGSVRLIGVRSKAIIWAGDAGDRTMIFGVYHRGGLSKVAERLVKEMRKSVAFSK